MTRESRWGTFPAEWGTPAGSPDSEERAEWVRSRIALHHPGAEVRARSRAATTRLARIVARRYAPGQVPE